MYLKAKATLAYSIGSETKEMVNLHEFFFGKQISTRMGGLVLTRSKSMGRVHFSRAMVVLERSVKR